MFAVIRPETIEALRIIGEARETESQAFGCTISPVGDFLAHAMMHLLRVRQFSPLSQRRSTALSS